MTPLEAMQCVKAAAAFIRKQDGSPEEALGLEEAVVVLLSAAVGEIKMDRDVERNEE